MHWFQLIRSGAGNTILTIDETGKPLRGIIGPHLCGLPIHIHLSSQPVSPSAKRRVWLEVNQRLIPIAQVGGVTMSEAKGLTHTQMCSDCHAERSEASARKILKMSGPPLQRSARQAHSYWLMAQALYSRQQLRSQRSYLDTSDSQHHSSC